MALGYTFSTQKLRKAGIGISSIRIYGNANNIFTFKNQLSKYGVDPETTDQSSGYIFPLTKSYVFGATVLFWYLFESRIEIVGKNQLVIDKILVPVTPQSVLIKGFVKET